MHDEIQKIIAKQEGETSQAYAAFLYYASLPLNERGKGAFIRVAEHIGSHRKYIESWAHVHNWSDRVGTLDAHDFLEQHKQRSELAKEDNLRWLSANRDVKEQSIKLSQKMLSVAGNLLETAELVEKVVEGDYVVTTDGRRVPTKTIVHMKSKISDIPRLVETGVKIARLAAELPTEIIDETHGLLTADLSKLSDEELSAYREKNNKDILQLAAGSKVYDLDAIDSQEPIG